MGWLFENAGGHEGYVAVLGPDGRAADAYGRELLFRRRADGAGTSSIRGIPTTADMYDSVPWSQASGWRVECACGWRGTTWQRNETTASNPDEEDELWPLQVRLPDGRTVEDAGLQEWERHMQPHLRLHDVRTAATAVDEAHAVLDAAIAAARTGHAPASWGQIGQAVGITGQSAHDRWSADHPSGTFGR